MTFLNYKKSSLVLLYILGFVFAFTSSLPAYINSSFLKSLTGEQAIGLIYTCGSIFSLIFLILIPKLLRRYGNFKITLFLIILYFLNFLGLAFGQNSIFVILCFMLSGALATTIYFNFDIFIEHHSLNNKTGNIRGLYLTSMNFAWLLSPWVAGTIAEEYTLKSIYFVSAIVMIPVIIIFLSGLKDFKDKEYKDFKLIETIRSIKNNKNIKNIIFSAFLLQTFYAWMAIYTPIYLNEYLGLSWGIIGIIFSIMLIPFVLTEVPLGYMADKKIGEKEILTTGFIIIAIATATISLIHTGNNYIILAIILFMTRVGAAMIELMNDTYFFKQINDGDLNTINLYRTASPIAYIISPIIATIILLFIPFSYIFLILSFIMILGIKCSSAIKDTL